VLAHIERRKVEAKQLRGTLENSQASCSNTRGTVPNQRPLDRFEVAHQLLPFGIGLGWCDFLELRRMLIECTRRRR
jgi:hypothetical protein